MPWFRDANARNRRRVEPVTATVPRVFRDVAHSGTFLPAIVMPERVALRDSREREIFTSLIYERGTACPQKPRTIRILR